MHMLQKQDILYNVGKGWSSPRLTSEKPAFLNSCRETLQGTVNGKRCHHSFAVAYRLRPADLA